MRRIRSLPALTILVAVVLSSPRMAFSGFIEFAESTKLNADVNARLSRASDSLNDAHEAHDTGDLSKQNVSADASATLPIDVETGATTNANASAAIAGGDNDFQLTGSAASSLPVNCPFDALTQAVSTIDLPFVLGAGSTAKISYELTIDADVLNDQKVTVLLTRDGELDPIISKVFLESSNADLDPIGPGSYRLLLIAGAQSTTRGIPGESGTAAFDVTISAESATSIPLPAGVGPGAMLLVAAAIAGRRRWAMKL
jgi:hypothetical protein